MERVAALRRRTRIHKRLMARARPCARPLRLGAGGAGARLDARTLRLVGRTDSLAKLALAYGAHLTRRRLSPPRSQLQRLLDTYAPDGLRPLTADEQARHPKLIGCINCGLCALAAGRMGKTR